MKNKKQVCLSVLIYISVFQPSILLSQNLKMIGVRIWDSEKKSFGVLSDIEIQKGLVKSIQPSTKTQTETVRYLLPGFCDASVTLGSDALGGEISKDALPFHLQSFLATGFSHVESVSDPDLQNLKDEISKARLVGPIISQSQKPILLQSHFVSGDAPTKQYNLKDINHPTFLKDADPSRSKHLPIFLKRASQEMFSQADLFQLREEAQKNGYTPIVYSFADPNSWEDALDAGYQVLFQSLPPNAHLEAIQRRSFVWAPMLNITYLQSMKVDPTLLGSKVKSYAKFHPVFQEKFLESFLLSIGEGEASPQSKKMADQFESLYSSLDGFPQDRLIFASGSGHFGSYPGLGAIIEADLWLKRWKLQLLPESKSIRESESTSFWQKLWGSFQRTYSIREVNQDPETINQNQRDLITVLTQNTCLFIKADHEGRIRLGGPAHFSVHKRNPFVQPLGIFAIESMVLGGKLVYTPKPEKVGKKP